MGLFCISGGLFSAIENRINHTGFYRVGYRCSRLLYFERLGFCHPGRNGSRSVSSGGTSSKIEAWAFFAFAFGAPLGFLGNVARVPGVGGLFFRLLIPLVAYYEMSMRLADEARGLDSIIVNLWTVIRVISVVAALALVGHTIWSFWRARRSRYSRSEESDCQKAREVS